MVLSKLDSFLEMSSAKNRKAVLGVLTDPLIPHTEAADDLALLVDVSEAAVRRWRHAHSTEMQRKEPKILIWDIESSPILGWTWGMYEQNVISIEQDWKMLTVSWTWFGSGEYHVKQLCDFKGYKKGDLDDYTLSAFVRDLLNEADYSIAHNGNAFDVKKVNAKFAEHSLVPPAPHTQIDTLMVARRNMKMSSNKLDYLGEILGVGRKVKHQGFDLWLGCMAGDRSCWEKMREYAEQDVRLLESVFERLLPWIKGLNYGHFAGGFVCTNCGSENLTQGGRYKSQTTATAAWLCNDCKTWNRKPKRVA